jgi:hypothetical protein
MSENNKSEYFPNLNTSMKISNFNQLHSHIRFNLEEVLHSVFVWGEPKLSWLVTRGGPLQDKSFNILLENQLRYPPTKTVKWERRPPKACISFLTTRILKQRLWRVHHNIE